jgi:hypothetical protein
MKKIYQIFPILFYIFNATQSNAEYKKNINMFNTTNHSNFSHNKNSIHDKKNHYEKYWIQYSDNNSLFFRYLTTSINENCPSVLIDKKKIKTQERIHNLIKDFPVKICQTEIENSKNHQIKFKDLNILTKVSDIKKINIIGDTGCITVEGKLEQKCNILSEYPFSQIAQNVANNKPDLIIHVGDYYYSKSKCIKTKECLNRSYGDNLDTWKADFLNNAEVFLKKAPILLTRGNHEKCSRGGNGWSVIFDSSKEFRKCENYTQPYSIEFDKFRFLVVDAAEAEDSFLQFKKMNKIKKLEQLNSYISQFDYLSKFIKNDKENILVIHRPVLSKEIRSWESKKIQNINYVLNYAIQHSNFEKVFPQIKIILSGHTHSGIFLKLKNKNHTINQVVSGNSGAFLNKSDFILKNNKKIFDYQIKDFTHYKEFGFSELILKNNKLNKIKFYDYENNLKFTKILN